jgi:hypothetical protein
MNAYCPECETELDPTSGICPACRWDAGFSKGYSTIRTGQASEGSISDRYRGTAYDSSVQFAEVIHHTDNGISRGRTFVIIGLVIGVIFYGVVLTSMVQF